MTRVKFIKRQDFSPNWIYSAEISVYALFLLFLATRANARAFLLMVIAPTSIVGVLAGDKLLSQRIYERVSVRSLAYSNVLRYFVAVIVPVTFLSEPALIQITLIVSTVVDGLLVGALNTVRKDVWGHREDKPEVAPEPIFTHAAVMTIGTAIVLYLA